MQQCAALVWCLSEQTAATALPRAVLAVGGPDGVGCDCRPTWQPVTRPKFQGYDGRLPHCGRWHRQPPMPGHAEDEPVGRRPFHYAAGLRLLLPTGFGHSARGTQYRLLGVRCGRVSDAARYFPVRNRRLLAAASQHAPQGALAQSAFDKRCGCVSSSAFSHLLASSFLISSLNSLKTCLGLTSSSISMMSLT